MFSTRRGVVEGAAVSPVDAVVRRRFDEAAHRDAREDAERACFALLSVLRDRGVPLSALAVQARATMKATGLLWETASRLAEH